MLQHTSQQYGYTASEMMPPDENLRIRLVVSPEMSQPKGQNHLNQYRKITILIWSCNHQMTKTHSV